MGSVASLEDQKWELQFDIQQQLVGLKKQKKMSERQMAAAKIELNKAIVLQEKPNTQKQLFRRLKIYERNYDNAQNAITDLMEFNSNLVQMDNDKAIRDAQAHVSWILRQYNFVYSSERATRNALTFQARKQEMRNSVEIRKDITDVGLDETEDDEAFSDYKQEIESQRVLSGLPSIGNPFNEDAASIASSQYNYEFS